MRYSEAAYGRTYRPYIRPPVTTRARSRRTTPPWAIEIFASGIRLTMSEDSKVKTERKETLRNTQ